MSTVNVEDDTRVVLSVGSIVAIVEGVIIIVMIATFVLMKRCGSGGGRARRTRYG